MKKIITTLILGMFLLTLVSASYQEYGYANHGELYDFTGYNQQEREQISNRFLENYQYQCKTNQTCYFDGSEEFVNMEFKIREQKRFIFFNVEMKQEYILDANGEGEIVQVKRNLWSRLFGQEVIA